ncbi:MAG: IS200/IS605 family transposase, partial [Methanonatronarchaeia archaeon]
MCMRYDTQSGRHSKYSLQYHLIFCTKYRRNLLTQEVA